MRTYQRLTLAAVIGSASLGAHAANVLVVLSDESHLELRDGKAFATGFYLNELLEPTKTLLDAGHQVTFATPLGRAPTLDRSSAAAQYFGNDPKQLEQYQALLDQLQLTSAKHSPVISLSRVEQIGYGNFDAVYVPGGHAPMQDLLADPALGRLLRAFHAEGKTTALVCHGPIALLSALERPQKLIQALESGNRTATPEDWIYAGYRMTVISNQEEEQAKGLLGGGQMKFYPQTALERAGGQYQSNPSPWAPNVVIDRELITGQNPASAAQVGQAILHRLQKH
ncbi:type 1 glutamine amidotransferase domain-containing protein [Pseudomonas putida]|uniref:Type 1 glutamine amidotransferase domain-containing protein n=1 Tax=Pseudomonas hunanensis TaxID=1247546 RepID=A0ABD6MZC7_9PSED|nr:type 1 glutamine amidotransferase domain-containing protein [Pseudomonas hunanensis]EKT4477628.1 type 1 glutamine amidotransferase domain-containing protein [Pseudomonas putida]NWL46953.1 type 1 glutamine amidotransferase domain-containing protein [Pseudomonas hunanensis]